MSYLQHLVVGIIGIGATIACVFDKLTGEQLLYVYLPILGYTLKNGATAINNKVKGN